jgi:hypothetical protein
MDTINSSPLPQSGWSSGLMVDRSLVIAFLQILFAVEIIRRFKTGKVLIKENEYK